MASLPLQVLIAIYNVFVAFSSLALLRVDASYGFAVGAIACVCVAIALLFHHNWDHGHPDRANYIEDPNERWFQRSDVCNWKTCNHEMWILLFMTIAGACLVAAIGAAVF